MESQLTHKSEQRLLLNAESFGFGPAAAIASMYPHLRERFSYIGYAGKGHTLDLQEGLDYDEIIDLSDCSGPRLDRTVEQLAQRYDLILSAMDFPFLEQCKEHGATTIGYDALAWFWRSFPEGARNADLYLAQNFFEVEERLQKETTNGLSYKVPPLLPEPKPKVERELVIINLGGLSNPYWDQEVTVHYARKVLLAIEAVLPEGVEPVIATSAALAKKLGSGAKAYSHSEMQELLANARYAFMTPGLGNIFEAALHDVPTIWLPPANDSQGQQLMKLSEYSLLDGHLDWSLLDQSIDYKGPQAEVMERLAYAVDRFSVSELAQEAATQLANLNEGHSETRTFWSGSAFTEKKSLQILSMNLPRGLQKIAHRRHNE